MASKKKKKKSKVTDEVAKATLIVTDMTYVELWAAKDRYYTSNFLHYIEHLIEAVDKKGLFTSLDQEAMDLLIERYSTRYKSPLARALSEKDGK